MLIFKQLVETSFGSLSHIVEETFGHRKLMDVVQQLQ